MPKVMLVEDDETMVSLLRTLLEIEGFSVAIPTSGDFDIVASALRREQPDVLLLDVHLRRANGLDILRQVRHEADLKHQKILMTSGMEMSSKCLEEGANGFLLKPYMPDDLVALIRSNISEE